MALRVVVPPHPLIAHWLTMLRNSTTPSPLFAKSLEELGKWLTYEALRDWLPHQKQQVITTQGKSDGTVIAANIPLLALPQIPGGLELWYGGRKVLPNAHLCIGGVPNCIDKNAGIIIFLDQICDGADLVKTLRLLKKQNIITSQGNSEGTVIASNIPLLALAQIPGGLELWYGAREVLPNANLCIRGVPNCIEKNAGIIIFLDQISDGEELIDIFNLLSKQNVQSRRVRVISPITSRPGLQRIGEEIPDLNIFCACIDEEITEAGEISPGIGNPSQRLSTKTTGLL